MENIPTKFCPSMENINRNSKVCIVCSTESPLDYTHEYIVFITDLSCGYNDQVVPVFPRVRLDWECFVEPAICVLGSTLYIIEGCHPKDNPDSKKTVLTYEISDETVNLKLDRSMLKEAVGMNGPKISPKATITPDGNILMFSSLIRRYPWSNEFDFEMYEPEQRIWHKLPVLPLSEVHREIDYFSIKSFTFMNKAVFLIRTEIGIFTLNLKSRNRIWKRSAFQDDECIPSHRGNSFLVIGKEICVIPFNAYDIRVRGTRPPIFGMEENVFATLEYAFPELLSFSCGYSFQSAGVILLDHQVDRKNFSVCFLHAGINDVTQLPELMFQFYYCDLTICKKELSSYRKKKVKESSIWWERKRETFLLPGTSKIKSFKIVALTNKSQRFDVCTFSSVGI